MGFFVIVFVILRYGFNHAEAMKAIRDVMSRLHIRKPGFHHGFNYAEAIKGFCVMALVTLESCRLRDLRHTFYRRYNCGVISAHGSSNAKNAEGFYIIDSAAIKGFTLWCKRVHI